MGRQCERLLDEILSTPAASVAEVVQKMYAANLTHWTEDLDGKLAQIWQSVLEDLVTLADTPRLTDNATQADALQTECPSSNIDCRRSPRGGSDEIGL